MTNFINKIVSVEHKNSVYEGKIVSQSDNALDIDLEIWDHEEGPIYLLGVNPESIYVL